jgi:hypothetical protein
MCIYTPVGCEGAQASGRQGRLVFFLWQGEVVQFFLGGRGGAGGWEAGQVSLLYMCPRTTVSMWLYASICLDTTVCVWGGSVLSIEIELTNSIEYKFSLVSLNRASVES